MTQFCDLPDELLYKIAGHLPLRDALNSSVICKRFHRIVFNQIKTKIRFAIRCEQTDEESNEELVKQLRHKNREKYEKGLKCLSNSYQPITDLVLDSINLDFDDICDVDRWRLIASHLTLLRITGCTITEKHLLAILSPMSCLTELHLNDNHYFVKFRKIVSNVFLGLNKLQVLSFSGNKSFRLSDALFVAITSHCHNLRVLDLSQCKIVFHFHIMRRYYGFDSCQHWKHPTDYAFTLAIVKAFVLTFGSHLKRLDLSRTDVCSDHLVELIASQHSIGLEEVVIKECHNVSEESVVALERCSNNIRFIR